MNIPSKIITFIIGFFMLIPGLVKFRDPFKTFFDEQIALSQMPFPILSRIMGQGGEIITGLMIFSLLFFWKKMVPAVRSKLFILSHLMLLGIMFVALYVHWHPEVPAEILPFERKEPILTVVLIVLGGMNFALNRKALRALR